ncbi:uncharacterized protein LOC143290927 [Babylonia areolata]|uniref:uncharacterized protein LOC143290927 n=1 Tax=Babylonia areolata TaxID=304850 RepID=UPI003FD64318
MFNLDQQGMMGAKADNSSEPPCLKRHLSVIEEHLDEDQTAEEAAKPRNRQKTPNTADPRSQQQEQQETHNRTGNGSHLQGGTTNAAAAKKTRKKAVYGAHSPVFVCSPHNHHHHHHHNNNNNNNDSGGGGEDSQNCLSPITEHSEPVVPRSAPELQHQHRQPGWEARPSPPFRKETDTEEDLSRLKDTATKLNLKTRRPSYLTWRAEYLDKPREAAAAAEVKVKVAECWSGDGRLTAERKERIDSDLRWIKGQLIDLRRQDQSLARQLLGIRHELSNLRLAASCEEHRDLLDDAQDHVEELRELSRFVDFPPELLAASSSSSSPLRHIGVTKMNLSSRRFSTC